MNAMYSAYMPMLSAAVFDNTGKLYDVNKIITPDFLFDIDAYHNYSRFFLPITYVLSYALQFAALASLFTHTACWHGRDMWKQWKASLREVRNEKRDFYQPVPQPRPDNAETRTSVPSRLSRMSTSSEPNLENLMELEDVHSRLMRRYDDVPILWYLITGLSMTAIGIFIVE